MTTALEVYEAGTIATKSELDVADVVAQVQKIQGVMKSVMQENQHYGRIPGTPKPTLFKPGAEKLCLTFRLDPQYEVAQSIETDELVTFTVRCQLYHIVSGQRIASGMGSCSSKERKYRGKDTWDIHNTILKMASKRALVAAVLNGTAASDIFTQDIEDDEPANGRRQADEARQAIKQAPQRPLATIPAGVVTAGRVSGRPALPATEPQIKTIYAVGRGAQAMDEAETEARCREIYGVRPDELSRIQAAEFIDALTGGAKAPTPVEAMISPHQKAEIKRLSERARITWEEVVSTCRETFGKGPNVLTFEEAGRFINALSELPSFQEDEGDDE